MAQQTYDRSEEDVGNIVALEHVNVNIPDQRLATTFYMSGLGFTRDPYLMTGTDVMWVNLGRNQFHLATGPAQVVCGTIGLVIQDYDALPGRLEKVGPMLDGTRFAVTPANDHIDVTCPWGNRFRCHPPGPRFAPMVLGMPYIAFDVRPGTAASIARFYREVLGVAAACADDAGTAVARVPAGVGQTMEFRETDGEVPAFDGHHIQIYLADFSGPHRRLLERGLITEESDRHQYRFVAIVDPGTGEPLFEVEHEVRSLRHPLWGRPLVNRDPAQRVMAYQPGHDALRLG